jgi:hypothetical protein
VCGLVMTLPWEPVHRIMRDMIVRIGLLLVVVTAVAGCSDATISNGPVPSTTVEVGLVYAGGPAPSSGATYLRPGKVTLRREGGPSYTVPVSGGHRTLAVVQPGAYTVEARSGDAQCIATHVDLVATKPNTATDVTATCSVK